MTTPTGTIKFSQIEAEFGTPLLNNLGAYRINQAVGDRSWPLDAGVPTSGAISFSQLKGKTLNVVVDYVGAATTTPGTAIDNFTSRGTVIGGFTSLPGSTHTKKAYHLIREQILGGFTSGSWDNNTVLLEFIITNSGSIYGYGGKGGDGANIDEPAPNANTSFYSSHSNSIRYGATDGGPALATSYPCNVIVESGGVLVGGGGGGGGGGYQYNPGPDARGAGYGGGGGAGYPPGNGGAGGYVNDGGLNNNVCQGSPGSPGTSTTGGLGAPKPGSPCQLTGGNNGGYGGDGGNPGNAGGAGENKSNTTGGTGGAAGAAVSHPGVTVSVTNSGTIVGGY